MRFSVILVAAISMAFGGCDPPDVDVGCGPCGETAEAACDQCAPVATAFCVHGACVDRGEDAVDVVATFLIARAVDGVRGLAYALVPGDEECASLDGAFADSLTALASGPKTLEGGDLHPGVGLGRVPEGEVTLFALATSEPAGDGEVLAQGCAAGLTATAPTLEIPQVTLE